jgi:hypothetical protein
MVVAGTHDDDLLARKSCWKEIVLTREFDLNANSARQTLCPPNPLMPNPL